METLEENFFKKRIFKKEDHEYQINQIIKKSIIEDMEIYDV